MFYFKEVLCKLHPTSIRLVLREACGLWANFMGKKLKTLIFANVRAENLKTYFIISYFNIVLILIFFMEMPLIFQFKI
jgi:hypothetical protein